VNERPSLLIPPQLVLVLGVLSVSTASTLIRLAQADLDPLAVAAWRLTLASVILAPFALTTRREELRSLTRRELAFVLAAGSLLAAHFAAWITSLVYTSVAASVVLVTTSPLFVALIAHFVLGERLTPRLLLGMAVAIAGSVVIGVGDLQEGGGQLGGDLLALLGAVAVAGYLLIGRRLRARLSLLGYVFPVYATSAVLLMGVALLSGSRLTGYTLDTWVQLLLLALVPQILGHSSLNWALKHLSATYVSLSVLAEPIGSTLLAWWILRERPTWSAVVGGMVILVGLFLATRRPRPPAGAPPM
jgi:drug/metabolite transporter (DMT)-like permease